MITTNKTNQLPFIQKWSEKMNGSHKPMKEYEFSVTELLKEATAILLRRRHYDELECDIQDYADINAGTCVHESLEEFAKECGYIVEKELSYSFMVAGYQVTIYGKMDLYEPVDGELADIKNTKEATYNKNANGQDDEWQRQLIMYAALSYLINDRTWFNGVNGMSIQARITDLSIVKNAKNGESTDKWRLLHFDAPSTEQRNNEILRALDRIREVLALKDTPDEELPKCSDSYCWADVKYKIYKRKAKNSEEHNKTAVSGHANYPTLEDAEKGFADAGFTDDMYVIEKTGGEPIRCMYYCDVKNFCPHYKKLMESKNEIAES